MGARCSAAAGAARRAVPGGSEMCSSSWRRRTQRERPSGHRRDTPSDAAGNGRGVTSPSAARRRVARTLEPRGL
eukprot:432087-Prymnesium_polylepis.1